MTTSQDKIRITVKGNGKTQNSDNYTFASENKIFLYSNLKPDVESVTEIFAMGEETMKHIVDIFTHNGQITIPVPKKESKNYIWNGRWFGDTAKTIVAALVFEYRSE